MTVNQFPVDLTLIIFSAFERMMERRAVCGVEDVEVYSIPK